MAEHSISRRTFLGYLLRGIGYIVAVLTAGRYCLPGSRAEAIAATTAPNDYDWNLHRWGFGVDATKCIGCNKCVEACKAENGVAQDAHHFRTWTERYVHLKGDPDVHIDSHASPENIEASGSESNYRFSNKYEPEQVEKAFFVPKLCNHCERPACVQVCPTGATFRTKDGVVLVDRAYCIGCGYCIQACPYGARYLNPDLKVADKCTWCYHRITRGMQPACVEVCPVQARIFGDMNDADSPISIFLRDNRTDVLKPETGNRPQVFYVGLNKDVR